MTRVATRFSPRVLGRLWWRRIVFVHQTKWRFYDVRYQEWREEWHDTVTASLPIAAPTP